MTEYQAAITPDWLAKSAVYQINPRTFSAEGTIKAVTEQLPFLAELGFGIMYLCPVFEEDDSSDIKNWSARQKASKTGNPKNPYRMNNYFEIDSEYGTMDDLRDFVKEVHKSGMKVILDLVYYHIGPNAPILKKHPEFVKHNDKGDIILGDWNFPLFDYRCQGLREYLYCNMIYYIGEIGVDGFRCDVGDAVPLDFWAEGLRRIRAVNPEAALINEGSNTNYLTVFHSIYAFHWHDCIHNIIGGSSPASALREVWEQNHLNMPKGGKFLRDMDNHDTVTDWSERVEKAIGHKGMELILALNYIVDGIPMVYCGNELGDTAKLSMFANRFHMGQFEVTDRTIADKPYSIRRQNVIKKLNLLKRERDVLFSGETVWLDNSVPQNMVSFTREFDGEKIIFVGNLSDKEIEGKINDIPQNIGKTLLESEDSVKLGKNGYIIPPYGYTVAEINGDTVGSL